MAEAVLSLGSNLGDKLKNLEDALEALDLLPGTKVAARSSVYETDPVEVAEPQDSYLNACVRLETSLSPRALLGACLGIEAGLGRRRLTYHGARVIDLDLLLYEGQVSDCEELRLPHPGILRRGFVLIPLRELYPAETALGLDFSEALRRLGSGGIRIFKKI